MSAQKLVHMANQIADFFRSQPEEAAVAGVSEHIRSFWAPVMRREIYAHVDAGAQGLDALALKGLERMRRDDPAAQSGLS